MRRGLTLPKDWHPSGHDIAYGEALGFTKPEVLGMGEDMRLWAEANSNRPITKKANWGMAFMGWMRRAAERRKPRHDRYEDLSYMDIANGLRESNDGHRDSERTDAPDLFSASTCPRNPQSD